MKFSEALREYLALKATGQPKGTLIPTGLYSTTILAPSKEQIEDHYRRMCRLEDIMDKCVERDCAINAGLLIV